MPATPPLLLRPALAERVWGGDRFGPGVGEAWDLSTHPNGLSWIGAGPHAGRSLAELVAERPADFGGPIGLLAKRLDCARSLSVQVHPREGDPKTEAWVVLEAEEGAGVYLGFERPLGRDEVARAALDGSLPRLLHFFPLAAGQAVYVPAGTVHAIGAGLVLFELQQRSDTTYRLYDWGRSGRALHLEEALSCARLDRSEGPLTPVRSETGVTRLVAGEQFFIDEVEGCAALPLDPLGCWVALHVLAGEAGVGDLSGETGDTILVPRSAGLCEARLGSGFRGLMYGPLVTSSPELGRKP